jgi:hypothetical protein
MTITRLAHIVKQSHFPLMTDCATVTIHVITDPKADTFKDIPKPKHLYFGTGAFRLPKLFQ